MDLVNDVKFWVLGGWSRLTRNIPGLRHDVITVDIDNFVKYKIRANTSDRLVISEVWDLHEYNDSHKLAIKPNYTVLVIGAQIGVFSVMAGKKAKSGKVYSFEPFIENYKLLVENISLNKLKNVKPIMMAVTSKSGERYLNISSSNTGAHSIFATPNGHQVKIKTTTLEKFIVENKIKNIDLLKMDCEGAEYDIFLNASKKVLSKIDRIIMEFHDDLVPGFDHQMLVKYLEENGFEVKVKGFIGQIPLLKTGFIEAIRR